MSDTEWVRITRNPGEWTSVEVWDGERWLYLSSHEYDATAERQAAILRQSFGALQAAIRSLAERCHGQSEALGRAAEKSACELEVRRAYQIAEQYRADAVRLRHLVDLADAIRCAWLAEHGPAYDPAQPLHLALAAFEDGIVAYAMETRKELPHGPS